MNSLEFVIEILDLLFLFLWIASAQYGIHMKGIVVNSLKKYFFIECEIKKVIILDQVK